MKPILCLLFLETIYKLLSGNRLGFKKKKKKKVPTLSGNCLNALVLSPERINPFYRQRLFADCSTAEVNTVPRTESGGMWTSSGPGQWPQSFELPGENIC